jgi:crotonobetainyl-CoA:carnitine CoA-transferase CaiB-like acyl-CoA transferase
VLFRSPAGPLPALLPPGRQSAFDYRMDAIPRVGEHTKAILKELGLKDADNKPRRHPDRCG